MYIYIYARQQRLGHINKGPMRAMYGTLDGCVQMSKRRPSQAILNHGISDRYMSNGQGFACFPIPGIAIQKQIPLETLMKRFKVHLKLLYNGLLKTIIDLLYITLHL